MVLSIDTMHTGAGMRNGDVSIVNGLADSDRPRAAHDKPKSAMSRLVNLVCFSRKKTSEINRDFVKPRDARCSKLGG